MHREDSIWITGLRIAAWVNFVSGIIGGFITAREVGLFFGEVVRWDEPARMHFGFFLITFIVILVLTFITTAVIMVFLDMARNIAVTADNTSDINWIKKFLDSNSKSVSTYGSGSTTTTESAPPRPLSSSEPKSALDEAFAELAAKSKAASSDK